MTTYAEAARLNTNAAVQNLTKLSGESTLSTEQAMYELGVIQAQVALAISQSLLEIAASLTAIAHKEDQK